MAETSFSRLKSLKLCDYGGGKRAMASIIPPDKRLKSLINKQHGTASKYCEFRLASVNNAFLVVKDGWDGLCILSDGSILRESKFFTIADTGSCFEEPNVESFLVHGAQEEIDSLYIGFDAAWQNYFHWIVFSLVKTKMADIEAGGLSAQIALPNYHQRQSLAGVGPATARKFSYSADVWRDSLEYFGFSRKVRLLEDGIYFVKNLYYSWTNHLYPTAIIEMPQFYKAVESIESCTSLDFACTKDLPKKIFITRKDCNSRTAPISLNFIKSLASAYSFVEIDLGDLSFYEQVCQLRAASHIIAPHGAGLVNLLFTNQKLNLLEISTDLDGPYRIRPWFYYISAWKGHSYRTIFAPLLCKQEELSVEIRHFLEQKNVNALTLFFAKITALVARRIKNILDLH